MKLFSKRTGKVPSKVEIQKESIDDDLKNALWNAYLLFYRKKVHSDWIQENDETIKNLLLNVWMNLFKKRLDELPYNYEEFHIELKRYFFSSPWYLVFDLLEFLPKNFSPDYYEHAQTNINFYQHCNKAFESELSAYRFIDGEIAEISSSESTIEIDLVLSDSNKYITVKTHIKRALELFSDHKNPDYRNSIKESISAVESYCSLVTNEPHSTLGQALKVFETKHAFHPAIKKAFGNLYGYTSNSDGIRHALLEETNISQEDARFMLVSCSAFINYLQFKEAKNN